MLITFKKNIEDPPYPIMHGNTPTAKEFNRRQIALYKTGNFQRFDFEQVVTILLEMFSDDYDKRHASRKKIKK